MTRPPISNRITPVTESRTAGREIHSQNAVATANSPSGHRDDFCAGSGSDGVAA